MPVDVILSGCDDNICELRQSKPFQVDVLFRSSRDSKTLTASAFYRLPNKVIQALWTEPICSRLVAGECPISVGGNYTYRETSINPPSERLREANYLQVHVSADTGKTVACVEIRIRVVW